ncbi:hypothetical protein EK21DRAFT_80639 [Setomelanomma holmii]|uniref:Uncharacterized protein n=1 Tax=Setomelanomma holmii TaxID=210430 RepID=A0A9P4GX17_9PLEO|nr:hypothetical protein EK21DRAFT_80639 [Setomelanomma holmii]
MKLAREEREADKKEKASIKELAKANKLYNKKIAQEKRDTRAKEKEEQKAKEVSKRKAERERQRQACDSQKAVQKASTGKRKASEKVAPRKKQKRSVRDNVDRALRTPTPLHQTNTCGRRILQPRKYW